MAQHFLAKQGVLTIRRCTQSNMEKLAKATGAKIVINIEELTSDDLGHADLAEERKVGEDKWDESESRDHADPRWNGQGGR
jgi:chaperonin GroEL (HSP60 family)